jgi:hypothetical protein
MRQKSFIPIIIVIILAIAGIVGAYYFGSKKTNIIPVPSETPSAVATNTPTQTDPTVKSTTDPTVEWKTYISSKYGFSFRYPDGYKVEERVPGFMVIALLKEAVPQGGISIEARMQKPYDSLRSAEEYIKSALEISQEIKINNWQVYLGTGKEGMTKGIKFRQAIAPFDTGVIEAETIETSSYAEIFDQILSTFKFTQ